MSATERPEHLRQRVRDFVRNVVMPSEGRPGEAPDLTVVEDLRDAARHENLFAPHVSRDYGGLGLKLTDWSPVFQEAGYSTLGPLVLNCMAPDEGNMHLLEEVGTPEQKERFLRPLAAGETRSCFAMTEPHPGAGSDPTALQTTAERVAGGWQLNGHKRFTSGAEGASFGVVMARTGAQVPGRMGATMFLVDMADPGVELGERIHTIDRAIVGGHPHVHFTDCLVPDDLVLGEPGEGFRYAQARLGPARLTHCMRWLGLARRALDTALDRTSERTLFGQPVRDLGLAQALIAQSVIDIESSSALIDSAARALEARRPDATNLSAAAKVHCSEAIHRVIDTAIQLCGGDGVSDALPLAQFLAEVRPFRIYDGANEALKWSIARAASRARDRERQFGAGRLDVLSKDRL